MLLVTKHDIRTNRIVLVFPTDTSVNSSGMPVLFTREVCVGRSYYIRYVESDHTLTSRDDFMSVHHNNRPLHISDLPQRYS